MLAIVLATLLFAAWAIAFERTREANTAAPPPGPPSTSSPSPRPVASPSPDDGPAAAEQVEIIAAEVEEIRELEFQNPVEPDFLSPRQMAREARLMAEGFDPGEIEGEQRIYLLLGIITEDYDLAAALGGLLAGNIAGFYDPSTERLVVRAENVSEPLSPTEKSVVAHELDHALADQNLGLGRDDLDPADSDEILAKLALIEGDATRTQQLYQSRLSSGEQLSMVSDPQIAEAQAALATVPHYVQRWFLFPYVQGLTFVNRLHDKGGWAAVDDAYASPPGTTFEILFPERYIEEEYSPSGVEGAGDPGGSWGEADQETTIGAAQLSWLFEAPRDDRRVALSDPLGRARAWDGGLLQLWTSGGDAALSLRFNDGGTGAGALCDSINVWYRVTFPTARAAAAEPGEVFALRHHGRRAVLACPGNEVRLGIAPDLATTRGLID